MVERVFQKQKEEIAPACHNGSIASICVPCGSIAIGLCTERKMFPKKQALPLS